MRKTQIGWAIIAIVVILNVITLLGAHTPIGSQIMAIISVILLFLFNSLTIAVEDGFVKFWFGIGLIKGQYRLKDIEYCRPVNYFSMGWGIRFMSDVVLYNVSGTRAIELSVNGKTRKIWIGTNEPEKLVIYIKSLLANSTK